MCSWRPDLPWRHTHVQLPMDGCESVTPEATLVVFQVLQFVIFALQEGINEPFLE
jgi:hypothetical protein